MPVPNVSTFTLVGCEMPIAAPGPDLSAVGGRFGVRDLLEAVIDPSKEVSDQYATVVITKKDNSKVIGRIVNLHGDNWSVNTNMYDPSAITGVPASQVKSVDQSRVSPMPEGLVNLLTQDEVLDLLAFLISGGNPKHEMFSKN